MNNHKDTESQTTKKFFAFFSVVCVFSGSILAWVEQLKGPTFQWNVGPFSVLLSGRLVVY